MDGRFLALTGFMSVTAFAIAWVATAPAAPISAAAAQQIVAKPRPAIVLEAPPEDTRPDSAVETVARGPEPARTVPQRPSSVYYPNCSAARAAGATPILRGEPGYRPPLDRDGDGIACEPYRGR